MLSYSYSNMSTEETFIFPFNSVKCYAAVKSKNTNKSRRQCHNKHRPGQIYCGIHLKAKNPQRYDLMYNLKPEIDEEPPVTVLIKKSSKLVGTSADKLKRKCTDVKKLELNFRHTPIVVKLQALVRMYLLKSRYNCVNNVDFYTQELLLKTPSPYFISMSDESTGIRYGYDLRSLKRLLQDSKVNPFTTKEFTLRMLMTAFATIKRTEQLGYLCDIGTDEMTKEQEYRALVLMVFQKINLLGNYADDTWFLELTMEQLKKLYIGAEDIWNYRTQMPTAEKCKIVKSGILFPETGRVKTMKFEQHRELSVMIIQEFDRMVTEGLNIEFKKLGAMLALTALTEVSTKAAAAMPMYVQHYQEPE